MTTGRINQVPNTSLPRGPHAATQSGRHRSPQSAGPPGEGRTRGSVVAQGRDETIHGIARPQSPRSAPREPPEPSNCPHRDSPKGRSAAEHHRKQPDYPTPISCGIRPPGGGCPPRTTPASGGSRRRLPPRNTLKITGTMPTTPPIPSTPGTLNSSPDSGRGPEQQPGTAGKRPPKSCDAHNSW
jgi:hypothetical protein